MSEIPPAPAESEHPTEHILTVALEDWFQTAPLLGRVQLDHWGRLERRIEACTEKTLDLLDETSSRATFFVLGWVAEEMPELLARVVSRGHEIATKGYYQRNLARMSPGLLEDDLARTREVVEKATGQRLLGFRVAHGWLRWAPPWLLGMLARSGFAYDSSVRPSIWSRSRRARITRHRTGDGEISELPIASQTLLGLRVPIGGGNFQRQPPRWLVDRLIARRLAVPEPGVFYLHVWDLDPELPRVSGLPPLQSLRQYRNLDRMPILLREVLERARFTTAATALGYQKILDLPPVAATRGGGLAPSVVSGDPGQRQQAEGATAANAPIPISLVVPCFNEARGLDFLRNTLESVRHSVEGRFTIHPILVDDCSLDDTAKRLEELFGDWPGGAVVLRHEKNLGVAAAIRTGILAATTDLVASIDADCTYDPHQLPNLLEIAIAGHPQPALVTASPYHPQGSVDNVARGRLALSRTLSRFYRAATGRNLSTWTSCFRVYRRPAMARIEVEDGGFLGVAEMLIRVVMAGLPVAECPARLESRILGESKMRVLRIGAGHLRLLARILLGRLAPDQQVAAVTNTGTQPAVTGAAGASPTAGPTDRP